MNTINEILNLLNENFMFDRDKITIGSDGLASSKGDIFLYKDSRTGLLPFQWRRVDGVFRVHNSKLKSLWGSPFFVGGGFHCWGNKITTLQYCPQYIGGHFSFYNCPIKTLNGFSKGYARKNDMKFPREVHGNISFTHNDSLEYLELLKVKGWKKITAYDSFGKTIKDLSEILSRYSGKGLWSLSMLENDLIKAGYEKNVRFPGGMA